MSDWQIFVHSHIELLDTPFTNENHYIPIVRAPLELSRYTGANTVKIPCARSGRGAAAGSVWQSRTDRGVIRGNDVGRKLVNVSAMSTLSV